MAISAAIAVAVVRYRLFNLEVLVNRTVLVVLVGTVLTALYLSVLIGLTWLLTEWSVLSRREVAAAAVVVVATAPIVFWATRHDATLVRADRQLGDRRRPLQR